jgi:23S rRNA pseudouridine1911/1915/1917 synthase
MPKPKIAYLYEDEEIIVVNKPAGLLSVPDRFDADKPHLSGLLQRRYGRVWTVHRLDRQTSGLLVFARTEDAHRHLSRQFQGRSVKKTYLALLDGCMTDNSGTIDRPVAEHPTKAGQMMVAKKGKQAVTHYRVAERFQHFTLAEAVIETGRTHQIRVHMEALGYPLAVDELYGRRSAFYLSEVKKRNYRLGKLEEERPLMSRLSLHAWKLSLQHPATEAPINFEAPLPKDFSAVLKQIRKWGG